jgi:hypothetical protein
VKSVKYALLIFAWVLIPSEARADEGQKVVAHPEAEVKAKLAEFETAFKATKDVGVQQGLVYDLISLKSDLTIKKLAKLLRHRDPTIRNVAALTLGGQTHNIKLAGEVLMRAYGKDFKIDEVVGSVLEAVSNLKYLGYWPKVEDGLEDPRNAVILRILTLLGANKDFRAIPKLLEMYEVAMPARVAWSASEEIKVDTGTAGDSDQRAAQAAHEAKHGKGGSKDKARARGRANSVDLRNFADAIKKCVRAITGETFETSFEFREWYVANRVMVARKAAELDGENPDRAERKATQELPQLKRELEKEREQVEKAKEEAKKKKEEDEKK